FPIDLTDTEEFRLLPFRSPATLELYRYAEAAAVERRARPTDDVITKLLAPTIDGEPLTDLEFKNFFTLLVAAGNDTTRYTLAHGMHALMANPDQLARWRDDFSISDTAADEILRSGSVTMHFRRTAQTDVELGGRAIRAGDKVVMWYISANYDDRQFAEPFGLDLVRDPNDHLAFGGGPHFCLGAWLARLEIKVVFEELLPRLADIRPNGEPERLRSNFISGIKHLPVRVTRA
ncbi:MAG: cytochrome P450, partial [Acidimicrobiia bacterium]|nr:cytochrome P450 [Acidimicrobiia bacterium]